MKRSITLTVPARRRLAARAVAAVLVGGLAAGFATAPARGDELTEEDARKECLSRKPTGGPYGKTFNLKQCCLVVLSSLEANVDDVRCWAEKPRPAVARVPPLPPIPGLRRPPSTTTTRPTTVPTTAPGATTPATSPSVGLAGGQPGSAEAATDLACPSEADLPQIEQLLRDRTSQTSALVRVVRVSGARARPAALAVRLQAWVDLDELKQQIADLRSAAARARSGPVCAALPVAPAAGSATTPSQPPPATLPKDPATGRDVLPTTDFTIGWNVSLRSLPFRYSVAYTFRCPPLTDPRSVGTVIGTDLYSGDSSICGAAVHFGKIGFTGGTVTVTGEQAGPKSYTGSVRNGIRSESQAFEAPTVMTFS